MNLVDTSHCVDHAMYRLMEQEGLAMKGRDEMKKRSKP